MLCDVSLDPISLLSDVEVLLQGCGPSESPQVSCLVPLIGMLHAGMYRAFCRAADGDASAARWRRATGCSAGEQSEVCEVAQRRSPQVGPVSPQESYTGAEQYAGRRRGHERWDYLQLLSSNGIPIAGCSAGEQSEVCILHRDVLHRLGRSPDRIWILWQSSTPNGEEGIKTGSIARICAVTVFPNGSCMSDVDLV